MSAHSRAFRAVTERCPVVKSLLEDSLYYLQKELEQKIKDDVTHPMRDALIEAYEEVERHENTIADMQVQIDSLEETVSDLQDKLTELKQRESNVE